MADIVNTQAAKFVKEQVRPLCEKARALKAEIDAMGVNWFAGLNVTITNTADHVVENRNSEGVPDLTGAEVTNAVGQLLGIAPNPEIIAKPCVRALQAQ